MKHFHTCNFKARIPMIISGILIGITVAFLFGFFVMVLWNWLMPVIFGLTTITYWQAWGLTILAHLLFKLGGHGHTPPFAHGHAHDEFWKERFMEHMKNPKPHIPED